MGGRQNQGGKSPAHHPLRGCGPYRTHGGAADDIDVAVVDDVLAEDPVDLGGPSGPRAVILAVGNLADSSEDKGCWLAKRGCSSTHLPPPSTPAEIPPAMEDRRGSMKKPAVD